MKKKKIITLILLLVTVCLMLNANIYASSRTTVYNSGGWKVYLDSPDSAKSYYHLHFYQNGKHIYCLRLDNFKYCDGKSSGKSKVPRKVMEKVMAHAKVKSAALKYNLKVKSSPVFKKVLKVGAVTVAAILIVLSAFNVLTGPADDVVAWAAFLKALAW